MQIKIAPFLLNNARYDDQAKQEAQSRPEDPRLQRAVRYVLDSDQQDIQRPILSSSPNTLQPVKQEAQSHLEALKLQRTVRCVFKGQQDIQSPNTLPDKYALDIVDIAYAFYQNQPQRGWKMLQQLPPLISKQIQQGCNVTQAKYNPENRELFILALLKYAYTLRNNTTYPHSWEEARQMFSAVPFLV